MSNVSLESSFLSLWNPIVLNGATTICYPHYCHSFLVDFSASSLSSVRSVIHPAIKSDLFQHRWDQSPPSPGPCSSQCPACPSRDGQDRAVLGDLNTLQKSPAGEQREGEEKHRCSLSVFHESMGWGASSTAVCTALSIAPGIRPCASKSQPHTARVAHLLVKPSGCSIFIPDCSGTGKVL